MAPKTRAKRAKAGAKDPNPKQTMKPKLYITSRENDSKNTKRCSLCGASVRSEDTETMLQGTASAAANVSAEPLDSIQPVEPREFAAVLQEWNGRRRRSGLPTEDVDLEVAEFFRSRWASVSVDEWVAATTLVLMKNDPNYNSAPVQKMSRRPGRNLTRRGRRS